MYMYMCISAMCNVHVHACYSKIVVPEKAITKQNPQTRLCDCILCTLATFLCSLLGWTRGEEKLIL